MQITQTSEAYYFAQIQVKAFSPYLSSRADITYVQITCKHIKSQYDVLAEAYQLFLHKTRVPRHIKQFYTKYVFR